MNIFNRLLSAITHDVKHLDDTRPEIYAIYAETVPAILNESASGSQGSANLHTEGRCDLENDGLDSADIFFILIFWKQE